MIQQTIDKSNMLQTVDSAPEMIYDAVRLMDYFSLKNLKTADNIFIAGMGGSAIAGDLLSNLLRDQLRIPLFVNRDYSLPLFLGQNSLVFIASYSGETEETLSCLKDAEKKGARIICLTSGGKLKEIADEKKYPVFEIKNGYQPRAALPYFLVSLALILEKAGFIKDMLYQVKESAAVLEQLKTAYGARTPERQNAVKQAAQKIKGKIPVIFASAGTTEAVGKRLKNQLNENAKMNALLTVFPEMNHNEMVSLAELKRGEHNFSPIFIRDEEDHIRMNKRIEITKSLLGGKMGGVLELPASGKSRLARMFSQIYFSDLLSVHTAIISGIDPTPVETIQKFKKEMLR